MAILGVAYLGSLSHLPTRVRNQFVLAGAIYVGGALGKELPLGYWTDLRGDQNLVYGLIDLVEESMEMIGASLFLCSLAELLFSRAGELRLRVEREHEELLEGELIAASSEDEPVARQRPQPMGRIYSKIRSRFRAPNHHV